jgi:RND family efflux transporter MFP subunit
MTWMQFLLEWALRSSALILAGALLLLALRVKDPAVRLAAWTAMLCGSLAIPVLREALPRLPVTILRERHAAVALARTVPNGGAEVSPESAAPASPVRRFDWPLAAAAAYALGAFVLLLRVGIGLFAGFRLMRASRPTGTAADGIEIRESERLSAPLTLGIARPAIVLPANWREWEAPKLEVVLAHERSHVRRFDPVVQLMSALHRALLWHSPLSWFLHQRIVRVAEEASDDSALAAMCDRASYAQILVDFMSGPVGVPMGRYGNPDRRIHRILESAALSRGLTRWSAAAILALGCPLAYLVGAANPRAEPLAPPVAMGPAQAPAVPTPAQAPSPAAAFIAGIGNVAPSATVTVKPMIDGQLTSVDFKEGETVQAGQLLATIDPRPYQAPVAEAEAQVVRDGALLENARADLDRLRKLAAANAAPPDRVNDGMTSVAKYEVQLKADQANLDRAKLLASYTRILSPITGLAGLRRIDPGNIVHAADSGGIVVITQLQPITVVFTAPEDRVAEALARLRSGATVSVEAWNRDASRKLATGRLTAIDNQIDIETGAAKLKAVFDNQDGALINGAFVNVRMYLDR